MTVSPKFRGSFDQKIDAKGRVSIPAAFRKIAELCDPEFVPAGKSADKSAYKTSDKTTGTATDPKGSPASLVVVFGDEGRAFLECYSVQGMTEVDALIAAKPIESDDRVILEELYYSNATTVEIDVDGRIVMPQFLRERLNFDGEARFVGLGDRFEIWTPAAYAAAKSAPRQELARKYGPNFNPRSLLQNQRPE